MKTQIIQLNQNDDGLSIRDKMSLSQTSRILLVWPQHGRILERQIDFNLVKRHAAHLGAQLALVTHDRHVRFYARQLGIPVFLNLTLAEDGRWESPLPGKVLQTQKPRLLNLDELRKKIHPYVPKWVEHPITRISSFGISVLAVFILMIFILPSARIILYPKEETQTMKFDLVADPQLSSSDLTNNRLATYRKDVLVEGSGTIQASGSMNIPDDAASADLRFTNSSDRAITLQPGIIVSTSDNFPVRFITLSTGEISLNPNKSVVLPARAVTPGSSGNLPANRLVVIEGNYGVGITVTNPKRTSGGTEATVPSPTAQDLNSLRDRLVRQLSQRAITDLQSLLPIQDTLISPTISMVETIEETPYPLVGEPGNQLELALQLRFQAQVVSGESIRRLVIVVLDSQTPAGLSPETGPVEISQLTAPAGVSDGTYRWSVKAERSLGVDIQDYQVVYVVKGQPVAEAKEQMSASLPLTEESKITLTPSWWPIMPLLTMRIEVAQADTP